MLAAYVDNWIFFLLVIVATLFRWLISAANKASKGSDESSRRSTSSPPPIPRGRPETDEDQIRKFLEALGQPEGTKPPPPARPRPTYRKPDVFRSPLPPLTTRPPELPRKVMLPQQITKPPYEEKTSKPKVAEPATFEVQEGPTAAEMSRISKPAAEPETITRESSRERGNVIALLRSSSGLRDAMILREVLGPPRSLQPLELV